VDIDQDSNQEPAKYHQLCVGKLTCSLQAASNKRIWQREIWRHGANVSERIEC